MEGREATYGVGSVASGVAVCTHLGVAMCTVHTAHMYYIVD